MVKGPLLNKHKKSSTISGEDHLGVRNVSISISDKLQKGITSITPRARYWSFYSWILYDFIKNESYRSSENFKLFLKRQEWFYILANIAESEKAGRNIKNLIGVTKGYEVWNSDTDIFQKELDYVKNTLGGYGTAYRNVLKIIGLTRQPVQKEGVHIERLTEKGKKLAKSFGKEINDSEYFLKYKDKNKVPRNVLVEYGQKAGLGCINEDSQENKILRELFMPNNPIEKSAKRRKNSLKYYMHIISKYKENSISNTRWRKIMYDEMPNTKYPKNLKEAVIGWEIYQGRQLFAFSLETIWSYILGKMALNVYTFSGLIKNVINQLENNNIEVNKNIDKLIKIVPLKTDNREEYINKMKDTNLNVVKKVYNPLLVMFDIYNRFQQRNDFSQFHKNLYEEGGKDRISLKTWASLVQKYKKKTIKKFLIYIIKNYILLQHQKVALNKLVTTNNETYHFIEDDGILNFISNDEPNFNVFRVNQGVSVLKDLKLV